MLRIMKKIWLIIILIRLNIPPLLCRESQNGVAIRIVVHSLFRSNTCMAADVIDHFSPEIIATGRMCRRANSAALHLILFSWMIAQMSAAALRHPDSQDTRDKPLHCPSENTSHMNTTGFTPSAAAQNTTAFEFHCSAIAVRAVRSGPVYGQ